MSQWRFEVRSHSDFPSSVIAVVSTPYSEEWARKARELGGKWKYPFRETAWQFIVINDVAAEILKRKLTPILNEIYPEQDAKDTQVSTPVNLNRISNIPTAQAAPKEQTVEITSTKIADVVTRIVLPRVERKNEELKEDVRREMGIARSAVDEKLAATEGLVSRALGKYTAEVDAVNKRLDLVLRPLIVNIHKDGNVRTIEVDDIYHYQLPELIELVEDLDPEGRNVWLTGPAGSGKTMACHQIAKYLNLPFYFNGSIDTEYKLSGFIDAQGRIVSTAFRKAWEEGGVYLFDECDGSMASALLAFNAALANGHASFPDKVVERHLNTVVLAAANTWGWGGTANYVGRAKLDGAFLDRFSMLPWEYDENLERVVARNLGGEKADAWVDAVQGTRRLVVEKKATMIVSPRRSIRGAKLLGNGMARDRVIRSQFASMMSHEKWNLVSGKLDEFRRGAA